MTERDVFMLALGAVLLAMMQVLMLAVAYRNLPKGGKQLRKAVKIYEACRREIRRGRETRCEVCPLYGDDQNACLHLGDAEAAYQHRSERLTKFVKGR